MTKTDLINMICELDPRWLNARGRLYSMTIKQLRKLYKKKRGENHDS